MSSRYFKQFQGLPIITENIKRLGDMKYMTILAIAYEGEGRFTL